jgi:hypothetical protein
VASEAFHPLPGLLYNADYVLYHGLACAALAVDAAGDERDRLLQKLDEDLVSHERWAHSCPDGFVHRQSLLEAERFASLGQTREALDAFERAIEQATRADMKHHLALAHERCGRFHLRQGRVRVAHAQLADAAYHYERWGATGKVHQLRREFPDAGVRAVPVRGLRHATQVASGTTQLLPESGDIDLASAMRATHALSSELELKP